MLGNCATGKLRMVRVPTSTSTMEITMATMGRLIKNFDIGLPSLARSERLGVDQHAWTHFLHALGDHAVARLESVVDNPVAAHKVADFNRADDYFVLIVHGRDLITALQLCHCTLRNQQRVFLKSHNRANFGVAA